MLKQLATQRGPRLTLELPRIYLVVR
jgi:hypothetical protein